MMFEYMMLGECIIEEESWGFSKQFKSDVQFRRGDNINMTGIGDVVVGSVTWHMSLQNSGLIQLDDVEFAKAPKHWDSFLGLVDYYVTPDGTMVIVATDDDEPMKG